MKLKATTDFIFTFNKSLKELEFNKKVKIKRSSFFKTFNLGKLDNSEDEFENIKITYKPATIRKLKYVYHIQTLGPGLKFIHLAYVRANYYQHFMIKFINFFLGNFLFKFENIFKILIVTSLVITHFNTCNSSFLNKSNKCVVDINKKRDLQIKNNLIKK